MTKKYGWLAGVVLSLGGCAPDQTAGSAAELEAPEVRALSTYSASLGTLIEVYGEHFPTEAGSELYLEFNGTFTNENGQREQVQSEFPLRVVDRGTARWTTFGPYAMPLSHDNATVGSFQGTVAAHVRTVDGAIVESKSPTAVSFEVRPSLVVHELQPISASCAAPVTRALGGAPYRMRVESVGFTPTSFTYTLTFPTLDDVAPISVRHVAEGSFDEIGGDNELKLPEVPASDLSYAAVISIEARNNSGATVQSLFALEVHRPLEVFYNGSVEVAEILEPTPVSGCIPGGTNGRSASYSESTTETRSRSFGVNWDRGWVQSHTVSNSNSTTHGTDESNSVAFGTTDGRSFNWNVNSEVSGGLKVSELVEVGAKVGGGFGGDTSHTDSRNVGRDVGINNSSTSTDSEDVSNSTSGSQGQNFSWDVSSSNYLGRDFSGDIIAGQFGVFYRQTMRLVRHAAVVTYNLCGTAKVVGELDIQDWAWSPDLAQGGSCPPLPISNLPPAACLISPCIQQ